MVPILSKEAVVISSALNPSRVRFFEENTPYLLALEEMIKTFPLENAVPIFSAIEAREKIESTAITPEIAFPHARIPGLPQRMAALGICPEGIRTPCGASVRLFFLFISPAEQTRTHLQFLAGAASLFLTENLVNDLIALQTPEMILEKISELEMERKSLRTERLKHA